MKINFKKHKKCCWTFMSDISKGKNGIFTATIYCETVKNSYGEIQFSENTLNNFIEQNKSSLHKDLPLHTIWQPIESIEIKVERKYFEKENLIFKDKDGSKLIAYKTDEDDVLTKTYELQEFEKLLKIL